MSYSDVVGQSKVKERLSEMVSSGRIPHALLFSGKEGVGQLPAAISFVEHLFCKNPSNGNPCGQCPSCSKISKLIHPDVHFIFPIIKSTTVKSSVTLANEFREAYLENPYLALNDWTEKMNAENKQPIIPVEEASDILRKLSYTSYEGGYKIMIIWQAHLMNNEAANKLLKILEEPPDQTIFILITSEVEKLLTTIISRVQQIPFYDLSDKEITEKLVSDFEVSDSVAKQAAFLANGSLREALLNINIDSEHDEFLGYFQTFMRAALKFDFNKATELVEDISKIGRERQKQFLMFSLSIFRDALMQNYGSKELVKVGGAEKEFLDKFSPFVNNKNYKKLVEEFNSNYYYIERNANPKIVFMDLFFKINQYINLK